MATPTLDEKLTQLQLMGAPAFLAAWGAQHPAERAPVQAVLEALVDHELARRRERLVAARILAAKFVEVQTVDTFNSVQRRVMCSEAQRLAVHGLVLSPHST
jgi:hypothetical protein